MASVVLPWLIGTAGMSGGSGEGEAVWLSPSDTYSFLSTATLLSPQPTSLIPFALQALGCLAAISGCVLAAARPSRGTAAFATASCSVAAIISAYNAAQVTAFTFKLLEAQDRLIGLDNVDSAVLPGPGAVLPAVGAIIGAITGLALLVRSAKGASATAADRIPIGAASQPNAAAIAQVRIETGPSSSAADTSASSPPGGPPSSTVTGEPPSAGPDHGQFGQRTPEQYGQW